MFSKIPYGTGIFNFFRAIMRAHFIFSNFQCLVCSQAFEIRSYLRGICSIRWLYRDNPASIFITVPVVNFEK